MCRSMALRSIASHSIYHPDHNFPVTEEQREEFLTARQLAKHLQVSESTVRRLAAKRRIPSVRLTPRIIRFHLDAVREALEVPRYRIRHGEYAERVDDAQMSFEDLLLLS
jgi:excisionase family DNA binding protein